MFYNVLQKFSFLKYITSIIASTSSGGFAVEQNVIPSKECKVMANVLDEIEIEQRKSGIISYSTNSQVVIDNVHILRPDIFLDKISILNIMKTVHDVLGDDFILSSANASRSGSEGGNNPHTDSRIPVCDFSRTIEIVATLCLDDYTNSNGATLIYPFSHSLGENESIIRSEKNIPGKISCVAPSGSIIYFLAQTLHDVGPNLDGKRRWGILFGYSRWWIKSVYDFTHCGIDIFQKLTSEQKSLFGFTSSPPKIGSKRRYTRTHIEDLPNDYKQALEYLE